LAREGDVERAIMLRSESVHAEDACGAIAGDGLWAHMEKRFSPKEKTLDIQGQITRCTKCLSLRLVDLKAHAAINGTTLMQHASHDATGLRHMHPIRLAKGFLYRLLVRRSQPNSMTEPPRMTNVEDNFNTMILQEVTCALLNLGYTDTLDVQAMVDLLRIVQATLSAEDEEVWLPNWTNSAAPVPPSSWGLSEWQ